MRLNKHYLIVIALLGLMFWLAFFSAQQDAMTHDEVAHIAAGYSYLDRQDYRLNPMHPPLVKDLAALPLQFLDLSFPYDDPSWSETYDDSWTAASVFLFQHQKLEYS